MGKSIGATEASAKPEEDKLKLMSECRIRMDELSATLKIQTTIETFQIQKALVHICGLQLYM